MDKVVPGSATLLDSVDKKVFVVLRDGRNIIGTLGTYDQFGNIFLTDAKHVIVFDNQIASEPLGMFLIRGENIVLLGDIDVEKEQQLSSQWVQKDEDFKQIKHDWKDQLDTKKKEERRRLEILKDRGFCTEVFDRDAY